MAGWDPQAGRQKTFTPLVTVDDDDMNNIQDVIIDLFADHKLVSLEVHLDSTAGWAVDPTYPEYGLKYSGSGGIYFFIRAREGLILKNLWAKYYNAAGTPQTPGLSAYKQSVGGAATSAPTASLLATCAASVGASAWGLPVIGSSLGATIGDSESILVVATGGTLNDYIAGLVAEVQPLTPTP